MKHGTRFLGVALAVSLIGCMPHGLVSIAPVEAPQSVVASIRGRVDLSAARKTQAATADLLGAATVSLIDAKSNQTVTSTVTTPDGQFALTFPAGFQPVPGRSYYIEAIKGLSGNLPGANAARLRTLLQFQTAGWTSLTSATPNGFVTVSRSTTAIAAMLALKGGNAPDTNAAALLGSLTLGATDSALVPTTPDTFTPVASFSNADFHAAFGIIDAALGADRDPVAAITYDQARGLFLLVPLGSGPVVTGLSATSGKSGIALSITGTNFDLVPGNNVVVFANQATVSALPTSTTTRLDVVVPATALTGPVLVQRGRNVYNGPAFTVLPSLAQVSPVQATVSATITVTGTGFDPNPANDTVLFGTATASILSATTAKLTVTVPDAAQTAPITVTTPGGNAAGANLGGFQVLPWILGLNPGTASIGATVRILGTGFGATGSVQFNAATVSVSSWANTAIAFTVPSVKSGGPISVTTPTGTAAGPSLGLSFGLTGPATRVDGHNPFDPSGNFRYATGFGLGVNLFSVPTSTDSPTPVPVTVTNPPNAIPVGLTLDANGTLYFGNLVDLTIRKLSGGSFSQIGTLNAPPTALALGDDGNLYVLSSALSSVGRISPSGTLTPFVTSGLIAPSGLATDASGSIYVANRGGGTILKFREGDASMSVVANVPGVKAIAVAGDGSVYFVASDQSRIGRVAPDGTVNTQWSGSIGDDDHNSLAIDNAGTLYFNSGSSVYRCDPQGNVTNWFRAQGTPVF